MLMSLFEYFNFNPWEKCYFSYFFLRNYDKSTNIPTDGHAGSLGRSKNRWEVICNLNKKKKTEIFARKVIVEELSLTRWGGVEDNSNFQRILKPFINIWNQIKRKKKWLLLTIPQKWSTVLGKSHDDGDFNGNWRRYGRSLS